MSASGTFARGLSFASIANWRFAGMVGFAGITLVLLALFNDVLTQFYVLPDAKRLLLPFAGAVIAALVMVKSRYSDFTPLLGATLRASGAGLLAFLIIEPPDLTLADPAAAALAASYVGIGYWFGLAAAIAGLFRPSFVAPAAIYVISTRCLTYGISGVPISFLDIRYMVDMCLYLAVFGILVVKVGPRIHPWLGSTDRQNELVGAAFGLHLANYFWSGVAKVMIGPTPWYWIFENKTYNQIPQTIESGILPIGHIPWLSQLAYDLFKLTYIPLNLVIVLVQLFAIACVFRSSWLKITSVLFDFLHIGIYVLGGLFFWPWVWNNLTIWWAARSKNGALTLNTKVACVAAVLLGAPVLKLNEAAWLAWFDVADTRQVYFEAVTRDGREIKVPSAFFLTHSYAISHGHLANEWEPDQYGYTQLASAETLERNLVSGKCVDPGSVTPDQHVETPESRAQRLAVVDHFLVAHHAKMLAREATFGRGSWYFRGHHHPSNPFLYKEFNKLSLKDVVGYKLVIESICHGLDRGKVAKTKVWGTHAEYFSVE